jgi:hypothetical protein
MSTIHDVAERVTAGASTPYARAEALRNYFRDPASGFVYDTGVDQLDSGSAIVAFLRDKHGFCVQFASAYAVMARSLGIPARVAVGFTPGAAGADGTFHVSSHDAHAWPEIWLAGLGWTHMFDPTPAASGTTAGGSQLPNDPVVTGTPATVPPATTLPPATTVVPGTGTGSGPTPATIAPARPNVTTVSAGHDSGAWWAALGALLGLAALVGGYVAVVLTAKARRRVRRREAVDPAVAITGAWEEALDRLHEANLASSPASTPIELAHAVPSLTTPETAPPMRRLARAYTAARYGDHAIGPDDADAAWTSVDELEHALDRKLTRRRRWRRRLDPTTLRK